MSGPEDQVVHASVLGAFQTGHDGAAVHLRRQDVGNSGELDVTFRTVQVNRPYEHPLIGSLGARGIEAVGLVSCSWVSSGERVVNRVRRKEGRLVERIDPFVPRLSFLRFGAIPLA